ncbi:MAG: hypothetical protein ACI4AK_01570 [Lepagella sp.]
MAGDTLILHRFMSRVEYLKYLSGEVLHNETDHMRKGNATTSKGFCFFIGDVDEWAHRLNGLVSFDVLLTVEFNGIDMDADVHISKGVYCEDPKADLIKHKICRELCTTAYSMASMRLVSADFKYSMNPYFISKDDMKVFLNEMVR